MKYEIFERIVNNCEEQSAMILALYLIDEEILNVINDYDLFGDTFTKLCDLCQNDYGLVRSSLILIKNKEELTKKIVHQNLNLDFPVEFVLYEYTGETDVLDAYCDLNYAVFKNEFDMKMKKRGR